MDNCASYSPHATHTLLPPFSQCISLRCSVRSNLCTTLLPVTYHVCLRGSSRTENACARTDTFTIVFSQNSCSESSGGERIGKLEKISAGNLTKVGSKKEVIDEGRMSGATVHFASLMDICHLKNAY